MICFMTTMKALSGAAILAAPVATEEKLDGAIHCMDGGVEIIEAMQAPAADRVQYTWSGGVVSIEPDEMSRSWLAGVEKEVVGFVNLHTNNNFNNGGDGVWYPLSSSKTQHPGDYVLSLGGAKKAGIEIGK